MNNERDNLKKQLQRIKDNDYNLMDNEKASDYLDSMLKYIGDENAELRDDLIYVTFDSWIMNKKYFSGDELKKLLYTLLSDKFVYYNIGNENDDSVLRRSFSILLVSVIIFSQLDNNFLDDKDILYTKDCLINFWDKENDLRGYDDKKGWMHAIAHSADVVYALLNCKCLTEECYIEVMDAIAKLLLRGKAIFSHEEDERLVAIVYYDIMQDKLLSVEYICNWLNNLTKVKDFEYGMTKTRAKINVKNFVRSLYFRTLHFENNKKIVIENSKAILDTLVNVEKELNNYI